MNLMTRASSTKFMEIRQPQDTKASGRSTVSLLEAVMICLRRQEVTSDRSFLTIAGWAQGSYSITIAPCCQNYLANW